MNLTLQDILTATGGTAAAPLTQTVAGVSTDTRKPVQGTLFIPLTGANFDGHNYIEAALDSGAVFALTERGGTGGYADRLIKVESCGQALLDLAAYVRNSFDGPVAAVTGSAGKTTTKDMLASVMSQRYKTLKTRGNFNNNIGMPLTVLRLDGHEAMMLEMGMNHLGEISVLSRTARPTVALITNIGDAHIENLGSRANILRAKSEIFEGLHGTAVLNGDDPLLASLPPIEQAERTIYCTIENEPFSENYVHAENITNHGLYGTSFTARYSIAGPSHLREAKTGTIKITTPLAGKHMVMNALMSVATGLCLNIPPQKIAEGIKIFKPSDNRMEFIERRGMTIINDAYNANPDSMHALLDMLADTPQVTPRQSFAPQNFATPLEKGVTPPEPLNNLPGGVIDGRRCCIFGDMLELGEFSEQLHKKVGYYAAEKGIDLLVTIGSEARHMHDAFCESALYDSRALHYNSAADFVSAYKAHWQELLREGDTILVKASRAMGLEEIAWNIR